LWEAFHCLSEQTPPGPITTAAFDTPPQHRIEVRGGRWTMIHRLGANIRANAHPESMPLFAPPGPFARQMIQPRGPGDNPRKPEWVIVDPEAPDPDEPAPVDLLDTIR
jgi:hypothetical protein